MTLQISFLAYATFAASLFFIGSLAIGIVTGDGLVRSEFWRPVTVIATLALAFAMTGMALLTEGRGYMSAAFVLFGVVFLIGGVQAVLEPLGTGRLPYPRDTQED